MHDLTTNRLYQRPWRLEDVDAVSAMYANPNVMQWIPGGAWDRNQTEKFVVRMIETHQRQAPCIHPVLLKDTGAIVGHCGLNNLERGPEIEIAYLFDEPYWHRGFATEIAAETLDCAFRKTNIGRVVAVAFPENPRSIAVMQRIGMRSIGMARHFNADVVKYEILRNGSNA